MLPDRQAWPVLQPPYLAKAYQIAFAGLNRCEIHFVGMDETTRNASQFSGHLKWGSWFSQGLNRCTTDRYEFVGLITSTIYPPREIGCQRPVCYHVINRVILQNILSISTVVKCISCPTNGQVTNLVAIVTYFTAPLALSPISTPTRLV